jgi:hypothetical protein
MAERCRVVVVASFRGGAAYVRELLLRAGYAAGDTFGRDTSHVTITEKAANSLGIEVSPYLVPFLARPEFAQSRVVYVTRNPARVVQSLVRIGYPHNIPEPSPTWFELASQSLANYGEKFKGPDRELEAAIVYTHNWHELAKKLRPDLVSVQIESGPRHLLNAITSTLGERAWGINQRSPYCPADINGSPYYTDRPLSDTLRLELEAVQSKQGYFELGSMPKGGHAHYTNASWHC